MKELIIVIVCCLAAGIGIPVTGAIFRERDFRRQVSGKRPERKANKNAEMYTSREPSAAEREMQRERDNAWLKSKQNLFGPK